MDTYLQSYHHIVFSTKYRSACLTKPGRDDLYRFITGILRNKKCKLYQINGVEDHIHILSHIHPDQPLSGLVKDIKLASTCFIKEMQLFEEFSGWQRGYAAFTHSEKEKSRLIQYIKNQEQSHKVDSFPDEMRSLLNEHKVDFDEKYLV